MEISNSTISMSRDHNSRVSSICCATCDRLTTDCLSDSCPIKQQGQHHHHHNNHLQYHQQHRQSHRRQQLRRSLSETCWINHNDNSNSSSSSSRNSNSSDMTSSVHITTTGYWGKDVKNYSLVLFCVYLLIAPAIATPLFTPTIHRQHRTAKPKWVNPCGLNTDALRRLSSAFHGSHYEVRPLSNAELLDNVILAAKNALRHSKVFKEDYVKKTFHTPSWWDHHETWKDMRYDWLPSWQEIPKHLHQKTTREHLRSLSVEDSLRNVYSYLQRLAVGLEQVVLDQILYDGRFMEEFNEAEFKLKAVLCELQVALLEKGILHSEPTSRRIMSQEIRDIEDDSYRNLRDWYIYRDYMNSLEYVIHTFDHLKRNKAI